MEIKNYKTWVEIKGQRLKKNISAFKKLTGKQKVLAMVKCNAYGHGLIEVAKICESASADWLGVDSVEEAVLLRRAKIKKPILIITFTPNSKLPLVLKNNFSQVIYNEETLKYMVKVAGPGKKFNIHLKVDTGMGRQGVLPAELERITQFISRYRNKINLEGVLTHLAAADDLNKKAYTTKQLNNFKKVIEQLEYLGFKPKYIHSFNTAATLAEKNTFHQNLFRVGLGIYGLAPSLGFKIKFKRLGIKPILTWKSRIVQVKSLPAGSYIGYGSTEKLVKDSTVALLPLGYYEGIPRLYSKVGFVLIRGQRCKVLGRVSMNLTAVDVSNVVRKPRVWEEAVIIGKQGKEEVSADEFAKITKTINYEVVTRINPLIPRVVV